jgi:hypothetical protein
MIEPQWADVTVAPRTRLGWFARIAHSVLTLAVVVGVFVGVGYALGAGIAALFFVLFVLMMVFAYWRGMKLRRRMKADPVGTMRSIDRTNTALGKFYASVAFATMGVGMVAIIAVFASHG